MYCRNLEYLVLLVLQKYSSTCDKGTGWSREYLPWPTCSKRWIGLLLTRVIPSFSLLQFVFVPRLWRHQLAGGRRQVDGVALCVVSATEKTSRPRFRLEWRQRCIIKSLSYHTWKTNIWKVTFNQDAVWVSQKYQNNRQNMHSTIHRFMYFMFWNDKFCTSKSCALIKNFVRSALGLFIKSIMYN